jgi:hypothetical protein
MSSKLFILGLFSVIIMFACNSSRTAKQGKGSIKQKDSLLFAERANLKKYALCKCLIEKYPTDTLLRLDGSLMGYIEIGSYGNNSYDVVDSFIAAKTVIHYSSKDKRSLYLMQCIDIYNSVELDSLVKELDKNVIGNMME